MPESIYGTPQFTPWENNLAKKVDDWRKFIVGRLARREEVPGNTLAAALYATGLHYDDAVRALHREVRAIWQADKRKLEAIENELTDAQLALAANDDASNEGDLRAKVAELQRRMTEAHSHCLRCEGGIPMKEGA